MNSMLFYLVAAMPVLTVVQGAEKRMRHNVIPHAFATRSIVVRNATGTSLGPDDCPSEEESSGSGPTSRFPILLGYGDCNRVLTSVGPFCSVVLDERQETCRAGYADKTCKYCLNLLEMCGTTVGNAPDICMSSYARVCPSLRSSCATGYGPNPDCDFCETIFTQCKKSLPTVPPTPATTELSFCSMTFDNIGPFCQYVIQQNDNTCQPGFSTSTCNACRNVMLSCGSLDGSTENICSSNLAPLCALFPQSDPFIIEFCSFVQSTCNGQLSGLAPTSKSNSGSGSGSSSGAPSGSGSSSGSSMFSGSGLSSSGSGSGVPGSGSGSGASGSGSGIGDLCFQVRSTIGALCTAVLQSPVCEFTFSRDSCEYCRLLASLCGPLDGDLDVFCEQPLTDSCQSARMISGCFFGDTEPSFECDFCAFYANNCFRGQERELCDASGLFDGCSKAFTTGYPCECFFTAGVCTLCNTVQMVCTLSTTSQGGGPPLTTTLQPPTSTTATLIATTTTLTVS